MIIPRPIRRLAIVNRGEAAMRCIRSVKAMRAHEGSDLQVIALYTDVDREAPFVRHADHAILLPTTTTPVAAYLDLDLLLESLRHINADAVWPGYGFVAESPEFVDLLTAEGIVFLGPTGDTMRRLSDKIASKLLAESMGIPVAEWSGRAVATVEDAQTSARRIGTPLLIKASAGGGGRGIRVIEELSQVAEAFKSAASEAKNAFGDNRLFLERMIPGARHIEVQIIADQHGFVIALGCRDCSVQRRHQKIVEEAPPSGLSDESVRRMKQCAENLAREVDYTGAGTVEFLVQGDSFYFLEMNPRLQVEHGITEQVTGLDLVELQIRAARGERLEGLEFTEQGYCIEARICAEDPDQGFLPTPGRILRFDPALGPSLRIDTGVVSGTMVPAAFDSLIAKLMAGGRTREQARSRLRAALQDTDLVIEGGATNKSYLLKLLDSPEYRAGEVDTHWIDRWNANRKDPAPFAIEAFVLAAVLTYRELWDMKRRSFFADATAITPDRIPATDGLEVDLEYKDRQYRVHVFSVSPWCYRIHMNGRAVCAHFWESGFQAARVEISGRHFRVSYDITDSSIRIELEGYAHRFCRQTAGQVYAAAPAMVISIDVKPGDRVFAGENLGLLEAMKMEIAFTAPVTGIVAEVRVANGQLITAGDVLLKIDPSSDSSKSARTDRPLQLPEEEDPLAPLFTQEPDGSFGKPNLLATDRAPAEQCVSILAAFIEEIDHITLGFDIYPSRFAKLIELLETPIPAQLSQRFLKEISNIRTSIIGFSEIEHLFSRSRAIEEGGRLGPSNSARLRVYLRRIKSGGAGIASEFLEILLAALRHYDVESLSYSKELERAVLRIFATRNDPSKRRQLAIALLRRLLDIVPAGVSMEDDITLRNALTRIASMRGELSDALADTALEVFYRVYQSPEIARKGEHTIRHVMSWLDTVDGRGSPPSPPVDVLDDLAMCAEPAFAKVQQWLRNGNPRLKAIALSALVRRFYSPKQPEVQRSEFIDKLWIDRACFDSELVLSASCNFDEASAVLRSLVGASYGHDTLALELIVPLAIGFSADTAAEQILFDFKDHIEADRLTLTFLSPEGDIEHFSYRRQGDQLVKLQLSGLHPEAAERIDLGRYCNFDLERLWGPADIYCFHATSRQNPGDRRLFVLGDVRARPAAQSREGELYVPIFEEAFQEATRVLRLNLGERAPLRDLHWNRIVMHMAHPMELKTETVQRLARKMLPNIRHLGIEKIIVRLKQHSRERPADTPREIEVVGSNLASSRLELNLRRPHRKPLVPVTPYERKVAMARRKGLVYPYEIIRMLTSDDQGRERSVNAEGKSKRKPRTVLPIGTFEEFDIEMRNGSPFAVSVAGRPPGQNSNAIVFGIMCTPTAKVPEGMRRVLVLSDPTREMGALGPAECDRVVAAIDLAERLMVPVEWIPISSGARIALDSGTENLDATARVVRRIVTFTQAGGVINLIISGVNVGAQSYWDSLSTMLMNTSGALIMTPNASMVLTGSAALAVSGSVSAEDEISIGGHERIMGPNGEAQFIAQDLLSAFYILHRHYEFTYVVPGEKTPRRNNSSDPINRDVRLFPYVATPTYGEEHGFEFVGDLFDDQKNPGRKRPFAMRALMNAVTDLDGDHLERWNSQAGAETAIVWDAHIGGFSACLIGIESQNIPRIGYRPFDGPENWNGGTLFPLSSKKVARAINAASGNRPVVVLANLSGFDGSPESMRKLQLEYGAEIARAVVNFCGTIVFLVVSRYHGGAYVVFSRELNPGLHALALEGSYASVIGGGPATAVVFPREVRSRVESDPRIVAFRTRSKGSLSSEARTELNSLRQEVTVEKRAELGFEFDNIHSIERAKKVGSLEDIIPAKEIRPVIVRLLETDCYNKLA